MAAITAEGVDGFDGVPLTSPTPSPTLRSAGPYAYTARGSSSFYGAGTAADPWLSLANASGTITFEQFPAEVSAVGADVFGTNIAGGFQPGSITVTVTDGDQTVTRTYSAATLSSFYGIISTRPPITFSVRANQPAGGSTWPAVEDLTLAMIPLSDSIFSSGFD
ncbi:hypothetical protein ACQQ2N_01225 [Dokdonella sp. MW10]|uniref:hypothetical protein n=1 Tax=Dokdonella sp. MW10 TaxID=2992926 RepID=UPI003F80C167